MRNVLTEEVPLINAADRLANSAKHDGYGWAAGTAGASHALDAAKEHMRVTACQARPAVIANMILELEQFRNAKDQSGWDTLAAIRNNGWKVAVHNDYVQNGIVCTFWLFTKGERALKGEGRTDAEALTIVWDAIRTGGRNE